MYIGIILINNRLFSIAFFLLSSSPWLTASLVNWDNLCLKMCFLSFSFLSLFSVLRSIWIFMRLNKPPIDSCCLLLQLSVCGFDTMQIIQSNVLHWQFQTEWKVCLLCASHYKVNKLTYLQFGISITEYCQIFYC